MFQLETSLDGVTWVKKPKLATGDEEKAAESFRLLKRSGDHPAVRLLLDGKEVNLYRADGRYAHS